MDSGLENDWVGAVGDSSFSCGCSIDGTEAGYSECLDRVVAGGWVMLGSRRIQRQSWLKEGKTWSETRIWTLMCGEVLRSIGSCAVVAVWRKQEVRGSLMETMMTWRNLMVYFIDNVLHFSLLACTYSAALLWSCYRDNKRSLISLPSRE